MSRLYGVKHFVDELSRVYRTRRLFAFQTVGLPITPKGKRYPNINGDLSGTFRRTVQRL